MSFHSIRDIVGRLVRTFGRVKVGFCDFRFVAQMMLRFEDRVVLVTGAGNGLGREYALAFGNRGASVVVNDLGGDTKGEGKSSSPADSVVEEIIANGGKAVANYDSVEEGAKLVDFAIEKFGRIDVIVHNAGILRDKSFIKMSDSDWDLIQRIHLRSVFLITRAAWPHMVKQKFGRIVTISSSAGIYGNFGQANYSAAKMGVVGLTRTLALEGKKYNILCNSIAPIAGSRLTRTIMPDDVADALKAKYVSPLVLWLGHEDCKDTGNLFECGAGWVGKLRWERTDGKVIRRKDDPMLPEDVRDNWEQICDFKHSHHPVNIHDANAAYFSALQAFEEKESKDGKNTLPSNDVSSSPSKISEATFNYCERDVILYALGVGVSTKHDDHLRFLYENASNFCALPTFAISPLANLMSETMAECTVNGNSVDLSQVLHGEQYLELFKPLPTSGTLSCKSHIAALLDKGSGAAAVVNVDISDNTGSKIGFAQGVIFIQRAGGFGGERSSNKVVPLVDCPKRSPDASVEEATFVDQAAIYRLSGDKNPLHIDPSFASLGGFPTPILHGLATYGIAARQVLKKFCNNDVTKFKAVKARFSSPVLPGQTLRTDMWREGKRIHFEAKVLETGKVCLSGGYVDLTDNISPSPLSKL